ncbi:hypothetical protein F503_07057 [Ophiostoma piceae UAMH 11346]|uniref:Mitochondrial carrier protein pet8 n=1 Tax=Ophiostoma piceae (strain UAMH 11346) TaxID=1262450 RepID=S3CBG5_OPHP1|nr:hypothetical protein F503_07057 [Ophiostoma piceae UAMH 11346]
MNSLRCLRVLRPVPIPVPASRPFLPAAAASTSGRTVRPFSSSVASRHGERFGESKSAKDDPDFKVEKLKQQSIEQQKKGKGEWVPELASDSEENIKADKSGFDVNKVKDEHKKQ